MTDWIVKYDPLSYDDWGDTAPGDESGWPCPYDRVPGLGRLRVDDRLVWQSIRTAPRRRLHVLGTVVGAPRWNDGEVEWWSNEAAETTVHPPGYWMTVRYDLFLVEADGAAIPERYARRIARPYLYEPGVWGGQAPAVALPDGWGDKLVRAVERAAERVVRVEQADRADLIARLSRRSAS